MTSNPIHAREIGEIAIRCSDLDKMAGFYTDILGLEIFNDSRDDGIIFLKIGDGFGGHQTIVALFLPDAGRPELHRHTDKPPHTGIRSSLHHLALTVAHDEHDAIKTWLSDHGIAWREQTFGWIGWRGIFFEDPEGNTIELVAAHPSLRDNDS